MTARADAVSEPVSEYESRFAEYEYRFAEHEHRFAEHEQETSAHEERALGVPELWRWLALVLVLVLVLRAQPGTRPPVRIAYG